MVDAFLKLFLLRETDSNKITESCMPVYCVIIYFQGHELCGFGNTFYGNLNFSDLVV